MLQPKATWTLERVRQQASCLQHQARLDPTPQTGGIALLQRIRQWIGHHLPGRHRRLTPAEAAVAEAFLLSLSIEDE